MKSEQLAQCYKDKEMKKDIFINFHDNKWMALLETCLWTETLEPCGFCSFCTNFLFFPKTYVGFGISSIFLS